jgi:hypothetical protein
MSTAGQPIIACELCDCETTLLKLSVFYRNEFDKSKNESVQHLVSTIYHVECPDCGHAFSVDISAEVM